MKTKMTLVSLCIQPVIILLISAHDVLLLLQRLWSDGAAKWLVTLSTAHLVLLMVRSVSLPQNSYTSHCGPCLLKALRHAALSLGAKVSTLLILPLPKPYKYPYSLSTSFWMQCPTEEVPKAWFLSLLKPCYTSKYFGDFPPGQLCLFPC